MLRAARIILQGVGLIAIIASIVGFVAFFELANLLQIEKGQHSYTKTASHPKYC